MIRIKYTDEIIQMDKYIRASNYIRVDKQYGQQLLYDELEYYRIIQNK